jgi:hypothetical protein
MSKPTDLQKQVIDLVIHELRFFDSSNDIHSPSHGTSIANDMLSPLFEYDERDERFNAVIEATQRLHTAIANLSPCPMRAARSIP